jgi:succinate dehydrogenase hydrophobic anchor subunit
VGILGGLWTIILFFPVMWSALIEAPYVGILLAVAFIAPNMMYSYVKERNGLAAAWLCQITANLILIFIPFL